MPLPILDHHSFLIVCAEISRQALGTEKYWWLVKVVIEDVCTPDNLRHALKRSTGD